MMLATYAPRTRLFTWLYVFFSLWMVVGIYTDGWAHRHLDSTLETFFTPWHGLLYSGAGLLTALHFITAYLNYRKGYKLLHALPPEHMVSFAGLALFMAGGAFDMMWHLVFGIEANIEALYSPAHLIIFIASTIGLSGAWRSLWYRDEMPKNFVQSLPVILSATCVLSIFSFAAQAFHPLIHPFMSTSGSDGSLITVRLGVASIIIQASFLAGISIMTLRQWKPPFGFFTLFITLNALAISFLEHQFRFAYAAFFAGIAIDTLIHLLQTRLQKPAIFRLISFLIPAIFYTAYEIAIVMTDSFVWSLHMWTGGVVLAGLVGLLLSYMAKPEPRES